VIQQAAAAQEDLAMQTEAREQLLNQSNSQSRLLSVSPDELWLAYFNLALRIGNDAQLLLGEDVRWLELGESLQERSPLQARALLAYLAVQAGEPAVRERARAGLAASLSAANLARAAVRLFADSAQASADASLPAALELALGAAGSQPDTLMLLAELAEKRGEPTMAADYYLQAAAKSSVEAAGKARLRAARLLDMAGFSGDARQQYRLLPPPTSGRASSR
jgi:hypothetical protein